MNNKSKITELPAKPVTAKTICISGKLPSGRKKMDYLAPLLAVGIELVDDVFDGLTYLVLADPNLSTAKSQKAIKLGVQVISESELIGLTQDDPASGDAPVKVRGSPKLKPPKEFIELTRLWKEIRHSLINVDDVDDYDEDIIDYYQSRIDASCYAFEPLLAEKAPSEIDRLGDVLCGPIYTCEDFEWPVESGHPMVPIIQLDLSRCSELGQIDLGTGLLQVFIGHAKFLGEEAFIRVIPKEKVQLSKLLPVPRFDPSIKAFVEIDWARTLEDSDGTAFPALQIQSYSDPKFTMPLMSRLGEDNDLDKLLTLRVLPDEVIDRFNSLIGECAEKFDACGFHLFGTFDPIQYTASERPKPLFCFESEHGFNWGDGNGQIFFEKGKQSKLMRFFLDWSCY